MFLFCFPFLHPFVRKESTIEEICLSQIVIYVFGRMIEGKSFGVLLDRQRRKSITKEIRSTSVDKLTLVIITQEVALRLATNNDKGKDGHRDRDIRGGNGFSSQPSTEP